MRPGLSGRRGRSRFSTMPVWSRFHPFLYIADLRSILLPGPPAGETAESAKPDWARLLGLPPDHTYNVILAWDLLNYLDLPAVSGLIDYLGGFCRNGTVIFTLIFDQKEMPDGITVYQISDESHLQYEYAGSAMRACPRHQPRALAGAMKRFQTADSFRLRHGVIEYLFEYEGNIEEGPSAV